MNKFKQVMSSLTIALLGGFVAVSVYSEMNDQQPKIIEVKDQHTPFQLASLPGQATLPDLTYASENSVHAVVHITSQTETSSRQYANPLYEYFYGDRYAQREPRVQEGFGSGVIISSDGYIVTNNHVIEGADRLKVALNDNREFEAKIIGRDPNTDVAVIKVDAENLPFLQWGDSDALKLGEWVLAVGNPFNLTSTVTAGIVSAKARSIGIMGGNMPIESFIQTDAAVNPGNSGGALVNQRGELIGINTAIASRTGSYAGYSFAVPAAIAKKIATDLMEYGEVQRALLGISIPQNNAERIKELDLGINEGVFVGAVSRGSGAEEAGIEAGDVITAIDGKKVGNYTELTEIIGQQSPGDKVSVVVNREGKLKQFEVVLRNQMGDTSIVKETLSALGAEFEPIDGELKKKLRLYGGLQVTDIDDGKMKDAGIEEGFIIVEVSKQNVFNQDQLKQAIENTPAHRDILIEGVYPNGDWTFYILDSK